MQVMCRKEAIDTQDKNVLFKKDRLVNKEMNPEFTRVDHKTFIGRDLFTKYNTETV